MAVNMRDTILKYHLLGSVISCQVNYEIIEVAFVNALLKLVLATISKAKIKLEDCVDLIQVRHFKCL